MADINGMTTGTSLRSMTRISGTTIRESGITTKESGTTTRENGTRRNMATSTKNGTECILVGLSAMKISTVITKNSIATTTSTPNPTVVIAATMEADGKNWL